MDIWFDLKKGKRITHDDGSVSEKVDSGYLSVLSSMNNEITNSAVKELHAQLDQAIQRIRDE